MTVNTEVPHADRDGSEEPAVCECGGGHLGGDGLCECACHDGEVWGDVRHHKERIEQLKSWVRYWQMKANRAEAINENSQKMIRSLTEELMEKAARAERAEANLRSEQEKATHYEEEINAAHRERDVLRRMADALAARKICYEPHRS